VKLLTGYQIPTAEDEIDGVNIADIDPKYDCKAGIITSVDQRISRFSAVRKRT
jgi:hypothetical protein